MRVCNIKGSNIFQKHLARKNSLCKITFLKSVAHILALFWDTSLSSFLNGQFSQGFLIRNNSFGSMLS